MFAAGLDATYRAALAAPHQPVVRVEVWASLSAAAPLAANVPISGGQVTATLASRVARRLTVQVDRALFPADPTGLLAPFGNHLRAYRGLRFGDGREVWFPVFTGRINTIARRASGPCDVSCVDLAGDVADAGFDTPTSSRPGASVLAEYTRLVRGALPDARFGVHDAIRAPVPAITWESDRAKACDDLADGVGAFWYPQADGTFVMRFVPWTRPATPVVTLADGPGGIVTDSKLTYTRDGVVNAVTVTGERADGTPPQRVTVRDTDPASPTYFFGSYGRKSTVVQLQTSTGATQARTTATTTLRRAAAAAQAWELACVPDPSLELGDVVTVTAQARTSTQVIAAITMPLTPAGVMTLSTRTLTP